MNTPEGVLLSLLGVFFMGVGCAAVLLGASLILHVMAWKP